MRVSVTTKRGEFVGEVAWSNDKGAYIQFDAIIGPHGWFTWDKIVKLDENPNP